MEESWGRAVRRLTPPAIQRGSMVAGAGTRIVWAVGAGKTGMELTGLGDGLDMGGRKKQ